MTWFFQTVFSCIFTFDLQAGTERLIPPLPYRIAKALDPTLYRNVELDIVQEEKRGETDFTPSQILISDMYQ